MQPPPRKGNYAKFLKNLHSEQINKLVLKNQHECDLLEDIRTFTLKRSSIEKSYSEALLKISSAYLNKKIPNIPDIKLDGGEEKWNMWNVWRTVLEENEKLARARLAAVEVFQQQIADDAKFLRTHKVQMAKKCIDQLAMVQKELQTTVQDVDKTKKFYFDEEHSAHDVRDKARDIEEKLKKKKGSFFQSITSLQKNSQKFSTKRDQLEEKSTGARNDYLLCLASANAHQTRYFLVDLQQCMTIMESGVYEKVAEYLSLMGRTELLTCSAMLNSYGTIRDQANQLTREYNLQCCYLYYPVLKQHIQYEFEPCDNDPVDTVTADHDSSAAVLSKEARRWATRIARENCNIREGTRKLQTLIALRDSGQKVDPTDPNGPDIETKIEEFRQSVRRAETAKTKAEARIECLRAGGVNVDEWLQEAETLTVQDIQRSTSSLSDHPSSDSFYDSDFADGEPQAPPSTEHQPSLPSAERKDSDAEGSQPDHFSEPSIEVDVMLEQERQRIEQLTCGWDDPTQVDWGNEDAAANSAANVSPAPSGGNLLKCMALYTYTAQNPDELSIVENEQLEVVGEGDGDGWLRARNYKGEEGYVPHNYLEVERAETATTPAGLTAQISFSSVDYTIDNEDNEPFQQSQSETANQSPEQDSVIATSVPKQIPEPLPASYCVALYDYEGEGEEDELTLEEGQIIRIVSRNAHNMDDGWWRGELEGRVGNFPSLVVEECDEYGEPISINLEETPPPSAPPVFTPPDAPADLPPDMSADMGFCMNLTRGQRQQYGSQFQFEDDDMPSIDIPTVEIDDENGEKVCKGTDKEGDDYGLGVAQIVITAATPMIEDPDRSFPPPENHVEESDSQSGTREDPEGATSNEDQPPPPPPPSIPHPRKHPVSVSEAATRAGKANDDDDDRSAGDEPGQGGGGDTTPFPVSSSTGSEGETTGPSTAENSITQAPLSSTDEPKQLIGGRASIPDELEPHQLARLQDLKESNA